MDNIIRTKDLNFYYGSHQSLKDINIDIKKNHVTALMGRSGSGKSTLLRTFNKIYTLYPEHKATGSIFVDGHDILNDTEDLALLRKKVGMVFQRPTPFPMTNFENIAFGVRLYENLSKKEMEERVEWAFHKAAIWNEVKDHLKKSSLELSIGQQQRLCIARAIAIKPEILLLDEPTSALDPKSSRIIEELILELKNDYTIAIVTHNLKQAKRVSDFTAHVEKGEIIEFGSTKEVFEAPKNDKTKEYIIHE